MEQIRTLLEEIKPEMDCNDHRDFIESGVLDSFDIVMLVSMLDETYGISIHGLDIVPENFMSVTSIWNLVEKYRGQL